jgi:Dockerin type I domain
VGGGGLNVFGSFTNSGNVNIETGRTVYFFGNVNGAGNYTSAGTAEYLANFSPGNSATSVSFGGSLNLAASSTLNIEIGGTTPGTQYDQLHVAGSLALGGALNVVLSNGFTPVAGNTFDILDWPNGGLTGTFSSVVLPTLNGRIVWNTSQLYTSGALTVSATYLAGDINRDGRVTVADISALMNALSNLSAYQSAKGLTDPLLFRDVADVNGDGQVNNADIQALIALIATNAVRGSGTLAAVPEPESWILATLALVATLNARRVHGKR